jgi:hypothetical protein
MRPILVTSSHVVVVDSWAGALVIDPESEKMAGLNGSFVCGEGAVNGDYIMWREASGAPEAQEGMSTFTCPTYVGRFVP